MVQVGIMRLPLARIRCGDRAAAMPHGQRAVCGCRPVLLARVIGAARSVVESVVHDDNHTDPNENGVEVAQRRGQDPNRATEHRILSETSE